LWLRRGLLRRPAAHFSGWEIQGRDTPFDHLI
jgi:hypothetical protein